MKSLYQKFEGTIVLADDDTKYIVRRSFRKENAYNIVINNGSSLEDLTDEKVLDSFQQAYHPDLVVWAQDSMKGDVILVCRQMVDVEFSDKTEHYLLESGEGDNNG